MVFPRAGWYTDGTGSCVLCHSFLLLWFELINWDARAFWLTTTYTASPQYDQSFSGLLSLRLPSFFLSCNRCNLISLLHLRVPFCHILLIACLLVLWRQVEQDIYRKLRSVAKQQIVCGKPSSLLPSVVVGRHYVWQRVFPICFFR